jgi:hypothetical protein
VDQTEVVRVIAVRRDEGFRLPFAVESLTIADPDSRSRKNSNRKIVSVMSQDD